jgi:hypothetical protein
MPLLRTLTTKIKTKISSPSVSPSTSPTSPQVSSFEKMGGRRDQHTHTHQHEQQHQHQGAVQRPESYVRVDSFIASPPGTPKVIASPPGTPKESMARREKRVSRFREELDFGDA